MANLTKLRECQQWANAWAEEPETSAIHNLERGREKLNNILTYSYRGNGGNGELGNIGELLNCIAYVDNVLFHVRGW